jgi:hypothetical protein
MVNPSNNISDSLEDAAAPAGGRCGRHGAAGTAAGPPGSHSYLNPSSKISDSLDDAAAPTGERCGRHAAAGMAAGHPRCHFPLTYPIIFQTAWMTHLRLLVDAVDDMLPLGPQLALLEATPVYIHPIIFQTAWTTQLRLLVDAVDDMLPLGWQLALLAATLV